VGLVVHHQDRVFYDFSGSWGCEFDSRFGSRMVLAGKPFLNAAHLGGKRLLYSARASLAVGDAADERTVNIQPAGHATVGAFESLVTLKVAILVVFAQNFLSEFRVIMAALSCFGRLCRYASDAPLAGQS